MQNTQLASPAKQLENEARIVSEICLPYFKGTDDTTSLDGLVKTLGMDIEERITVIAVDGTVLGDSNENPAVMENHSTG